MEKVCTKCGISKEVDKNFYKGKGYKDGYRTMCKVCAISIQTKRAKDNNGRYRKYRKKWEKENPNYYKKNSNSLNPNYIRAILIQQGFVKEDISPELIEIKRLTIKFKRNVNKAKNSTSKGS